MKRVTIVTPCYNEVDNVEPLFERVSEIFAGLPQYQFEHLFIDNDSRDGTDLKLRAMAHRDPRVKVIFNSRNFGHMRSPFHAMLQAQGDAVMTLTADFQDPPELIPQFLAKWEEGYKVVFGSKETADEAAWKFGIRSAYYRLIGWLSEVEQIPNFTGFGLYDQQIVQALRTIQDPYPYFRGLIAEIGFKRAQIDYRQNRRRAGVTKLNFYGLYDTAMLGIINHSKVPLRIATMFGFLMSGVSLCITIAYFIFKLLFWWYFPAGIIPILLCVTFFSSLQLFFIGLTGEYVAAVHTQVQRRPLVFERERLNF